MRVRSRAVLLAGLLVIFLVPGNGLSTGRRGLEGPRFRGVINAVEAASEEDYAEFGIVGWVRLEVGGSLVSEPILVDVIITDTTKLAFATKKGPLPAAFEDLREGQFVECALEPILTPVEDPPLFVREMVILGKGK